MRAGSWCLEHGRITEIGSHDELMQKSGTYRRLHDLQFRTEAEMVSSRDGGREGMSAVVYSMTGYASMRLDGLDAGAVTLSIKSVNHRFFDPQVRLPFTLESLDTQIRRLLKESVRRGHIEVSVQIERRGAKSAAVVAFNDELLGAYVEAFRGAAARHGLAAEPNLNELMRVPGMLSAQAAAPREEAEALEPVVLAAMPELLAQFNAVRAEEGAALADSAAGGHGAAGCVGG